MTATGSNTAPGVATSFRGKRILVTGHTGFKGGWLALWLARMGARVTGVALPPEGDDSFFDACRLVEAVDHRVADIRSQEQFSKTVADCDAEVVFHLAAQPLVRRSYRMPVETFATNVVGTAVVLDAALRMPSLKAVVIVTSDKCYENFEWDYGYRENDRMGGTDPYSASKGCTELLVSAYRSSFFSEPGGPLIGSGRAGNVFGGGDWAEDRLVPDIIRSTRSNEPIRIRNRASIRPWQHVLEPLHGYLQIGARLLGGDASFAEGWNFSPDASGMVDVETLAGYVTEAWGEGAPQFVFDKTDADPHEATVLRLDSTKAHTRLDWQPRLTMEESVGMTVDWYKAYLGGATDMRALTIEQIEKFEG
jgi:CDP-glucose 4,6-dehydratase